MILLTRPRTCTCTHTYYPYRLMPYELALVWKIEPLTESIFRVQRKERFALRARGGHVACATKM